MTWTSNERGSFDNEWQNDGTASDFEPSAKAALSASLWNRSDSDCCSSNGCSTSGMNERPLTIDPEKVAQGVERLSQVLDALGVSIDLPVLWPKLGRSDCETSNRDSDDGTRTIILGNGDQLTLGGRSKFELVNRNGEPVREIGIIETGAMDAPIQHQMSNGAIYRSRGGWNHDESITWPNGDVVRFSDTGEFQSYTPAEK